MTFVAAAGCPLCCGKCSASCASRGERLPVEPTTLLRLRAPLGPHKFPPLLFPHVDPCTDQTLSGVCLSTDAASQTATRSEHLLSASNVCEPLHLCVFAAQRSNLPYRPWLQKSPKRDACHAILHSPPRAQPLPAQDHAVCLRQENAIANWQRDQLCPPSS